MKMHLSLESKKHTLLNWTVFIALLNISSLYQPIDIQSSGFYIPLAGLVKVKADKNQNRPFKDLRCTEEDREAISYIITSMGENGKLWLLMHKNDLNEKGEQISGVHPLKFLSVVFQNEYLKTVCMPAIFEDYFKKNGFLDGLGPNMTKEAQKGKVQEYLKDFMKEINLKASHYDILMEFINDKNWEDFVLYLIHH